MDEVIFEEFKGTGNMEVHLNRKLSEKRVFPAIDIYKSGTRREELLMSEKELEFTWMLRKEMSHNSSNEVMEMLLNQIERTKTNSELIDSYTSNR